MPVLKNIRVSANNVKLRGLELTGWTATSTANIDGIAADGKTGLEVDRCKVHAGTGAGSPIDTGNVTNGSSANIRTRNSSDIYIHDCDIYGSKKGVKIQSAKSSNGTFEEGVRIVRNTIRDHPIDGIDIQGSWITIDGNTIINNIDKNYATSHPDGIQVLNTITDNQSAVKHLKILNNTIGNHTQNVFCEELVGQTMDVEIAGNYVYINGSDVIHGLLMSSLPSGKNITGGATGHNVHDNHTKGGEIGIGVTGKDVHVKHNTMEGHSLAIRCLGGYNTVAADELDYNTYKSNRNAINWAGHIYPTIGAARNAGMKQEAHATDDGP